MKLKKENLLIILSVVVLAVFLVNMFSGSQSANDTRISELIYTDFKDEVAAGSILSAQFVGDTMIEGFVNNGQAYRTYIPPQLPTQGRASRRLQPSTVCQPEIKSFIRSESPRSAMPR